METVPLPLQAGMGRRAEGDPHFIRLQPGSPPSCPSSQPLYPDSLWRQERWWEHRGGQAKSRGLGCCGPQASQGAPSGVFLVRGKNAALRGRSLGALIPRGKWGLLQFTSSNKSSWDGTFDLPRCHPVGRGQTWLSRAVPSHTQGPVHSSVLSLDGAWSSCVPPRNPVPSLESLVCSPF